MALTTGTRLGVYEIAALIGVGGHGRGVLRARYEAQSRRHVKVLPEHFATDPDRLARFKRESQVLASLNHPNIAAIYGFEEGPAAIDSARRGEAGRSGTPTHALILELVEGPTLADRIAQASSDVGRALSGNYVFDKTFWDGVSLES